MTARPMQSFHAMQGRQNYAKALGGQIFEMQNEETTEKSKIDIHVQH